MIKRLLSPPRFDDLEQDFRAKVIAARAMSVAAAHSLDKRWDRRILGDDDVRVEVEAHLADLRGHCDHSPLRLLEGHNGP